jgi:predicted TIM-barrel fold metal-dependent hydrolase
VEQLGAERILFGTDMPGSYLVNAGQIEEAQLSLEQKDMIYYLNAKKILGLE